MINEDTVMLALEVMGDGPRTYATTLNEIVAEAELDRIHSEKYLEMTGTAAEREAKVVLTKEYQEAFARYAEAKARKAEFHAEKSKAEGVTRIYQTERADIRHIERTTL